MTNIEVGDAVRVVKEGVISTITPGGSFQFEDDSVFRATDQYDSVEVLERQLKVGDVIDGRRAHDELPVDAVVRDSHGIHGVKTSEGHFVFSDSPDVKSHPACRSTLVALPA